MPVPVKYTLIAALLFGLSSARADKIATHLPWTEGVSAEQQARARELHDAGNDLLQQSLFAQALEKYQRALVHWDHPGIRFNMTIALIQLDRLVEAYENIERALRYGAEPLESDVYAQAEVYKTLLEGQVARLVVVCAERNARVTLDGKHLFTGPGEAAELVLTGEHQVVATKTGRLAVTRSLTVLPRQRNRVELSLPPLETDKFLKPRWQPWKPWALVTSGALLTLAGVPLQLRSLANRDLYDSEVDALCPTGCQLDEQPLPRAVYALRTRSQLQNRLAVGSFAIGGLLVAGGLTLVILNRPRPVEENERVPGLVVTPAPVSPGSAGIVAAGRF